jgi:hypothetical protein
MEPKEPSSLVYNQDKAFHMYLEAREKINEYLRSREGAENGETGNIEDVQISAVQAEIRMIKAGEEYEDADKAASFIIGEINNFREKSDQEFIAYVPVLLEGSIDKRLRLISDIVKNISEPDYSQTFTFPTQNSEGDFLLCLRSPTAWDNVFLVEIYQPKVHPTQLKIEKSGVVIDTKTDQAIDPIEEGYIISN